MSTRERRPLVLLRPVPGGSAIHDLWAGTKLVSALAIAILLAAYPGWAPIGLVTVLLIVSARLARIPIGVLPSIPRWAWIIALLGAGVTAMAGGSPFVGLGPVTVGLGGLLDVLRFTALAGVLLGVGGMVSWTTDVADVAPAVAVLGRPLRRVGIPVDEWAVAIALAMRAFPMLFDEFRILYAARRLRPKQALPATWGGRLRHWSGDVIDLLAAAITVALRRGDEMGDAITARGGTGQISAAASKPKTIDWIALSIVTLVCGLGLYGELVLFPTTMH